jgi:hypothetical protein
MENLVGVAEHAGLQEKLEGMLQSRLRQTGDAFHPKAYYLKEWGYDVDHRGAVRYFFERNRPEDFKVQSPMNKPKVFCIE